LTSLRQRIREAAAQGDLAAIEAALADGPRAVRFLLALSYHHDARLREIAARGIGIASSYHPDLIGNVVRRLVWAMNDESGTNAETAPRVIEEISRVRPDLLLSSVPDLVRLSADLSLCDGLAQALLNVARECPGEVGRSMTDSLRAKLGPGEHREGGDDDQR
jgi:hypothetical protein